MRWLVIPIFLILVSCSGLREVQVTEVNWDIESTTQSVALLIVKIPYELNGTEYLGTAAGSGVFISEDTILTARHVVVDAREIFVHFGDLEAKGTVAQIGSGYPQDWAVVKLDKTLGGRPVKFRKEVAHKWEPCMAVGHALGLDHPTVTFGNIQDSLGNLLRISSPIIFGNSGGGVFIRDTKGEVVLAGLTVAGFPSGGQFITHMGIAAEIHDILEQLLEKPLHYSR